MPDIRWLENGNKAQVKQIWQECFFDSDEFIDEYFSHVASVENGLAYFEGEEILADLFIQDFWANLSGVDYTAAFFAGCATLPRARKRGLMRELIKTALGVLRENGTETAYLHPFLHEFYRRMGFETVAYVHWQEQQSSPEAAEYEVAVCSYDLPVQDMFHSYTAYVTKYDNFFRRTQKRMNMWLKLLLADGGKVAYIKEEAGVAYALFYENDGVAEIFEMVYSNEKQRAALVNCTGLPRCRYFVPAHKPGEQKDASEYTMMRILLPAEVLKKQIYEQDAQFVIHITDELLEREYNLAVEARCGVANVSETQAAADYKTDIGGFAKLVAGAHSGGLPACMQAVFPQCTGCYFETY